MNDLTDIQTRFPALSDGWSRFDGPAGTQVVDTAIDAMSEWQRSGRNANSHGAFPAAQACDDLVEETSETMGELLSADPAGMTFGPSTTANMMALTRAVAVSLEPEDEIICTTLDHDANVAPWMLAARDSGSTIRMAEFDPKTGRLEAEAVIDLISKRTKWIAVTGSSNVIGSIPDVTSITTAAHEAGAKVAVDGVHLTPHRKVDINKMGCDVYATSSYKWYGPHAGIMWIEPEVLNDLPVYKVRPSPEKGAGRFQYGTPPWETLAGIKEAAKFLLSVGFESIIEHESARFERLLSGLINMPKVRVLGPQDNKDRAPTLMFLVEGKEPEEVAQKVAEAKVAVWDGHNYAVEAMNPLGLGEKGAVRAGVCIYIDDKDVDRLLEVVSLI
jgi:cysteine desulfurase family protein (TIGR01976 family)